jgi:hypothetical protein
MRRHGGVEVAELNVVAIIEHHGGAGAGVPQAEDEFSMTRPPHVARRNTGEVEDRPVSVPETPCERGIRD